jgi:RNA polymerase sigma-70 factor (ECF subfamily)
MFVVDKPSAPPHQGRSGLSANTARSNAVSPQWGALMAQAQDGNSAAYRELLVELAEWLEHFYRQRLPCERVEDGVSGALLLIHEIRHTYDPNRPFDLWLTAIAWHQCDKIERAGQNRNWGRRKRHLSGWGL